MARTSGFLSAMNVELISHEAHNLLQEVAAYEEPRLSLDETPTLSTIAKNVLSRETSQRLNSALRKQVTSSLPAGSVAARSGKGHIKDNKTSDANDSRIKDRREAVLSVIKNKGRASIKDISTLVRGVSEKTIQRELSALITAGVVLKQGERRWSIYSIA